MSDFPIISPDELDISKITATEPKKKNERLQSYLMYDGAQFFIETEWGRAPFGVRSFVGGEKTDYTLNISLTPDGNCAEDTEEECVGSYSSFVVLSLGD